MEGGFARDGLEEKEGNLRCQFFLLNFKLNLATPMNYI